MAKKKINWKIFLQMILAATLFFSLVYSIIRFLQAPVAPPVEDLYQKTQSDYRLMILQCFMGLIVMFIPSLIDRKWKIDLPNSMYILFFIFLYCAIYLGEIRNFYDLIPNWDNILHSFSGAMLGALGFYLVDLLNRSKASVQLSPAFVCLFAFCFALTMGALWEIYEYAADGLLSLNMQKFMLENGTLLSGRAALADTMTDLIVDAAGALAISILGYGISKRRQKKKPQ